MMEIVTQAGGHVREPTVNLSLHLSIDFCSQNIPDFCEF